MPLVPLPSGGIVQPPVLSKYTIKLHPIPDMLEFCAETFDNMVDYAVQPAVDHTDFAAEATCEPTELTITIVSPADGFTCSNANDWLHDNHARAGTLSELCTWREQHIERAEGFGDVVAYGTILQDGTQHRTPVSYVTFAHRWGEVARLSMRSYSATWRAGASFLAVLDAHNPSS
jgi:hypothetical protein